LNNRLNTTAQQLGAEQTARVVYTVAMF